MNLGFPACSTPHPISCLVILGCNVISLLFTDFSLLHTSLFRKHSIYPFFAVFHLYGYISSQFLKSLFSDVLSLLFRCILTDYLLNFSTSFFFYLGYILSLFWFQSYFYWKYRHYRYINTTITTIFSISFLLLKKKISLLL